MNLRQVLRAVVCAALVALCLIGAKWFPVQTAPASTVLQGEAAIQQLRADGTYSSLAAAIAEARFQSNASPNSLAADSIITQQRRLTAMDAAGGDQFGFAIVFDGSTAVIGAPGDDAGENNNQGSVYVFVRSGTGWTQQQKLTASDGSFNDYFGSVIALSGDMLLVGAPYDDSDGQFDQGAAYVFTRSGTTWSQQQKLVASDGMADDNFGTSVALSGDTAVVGAVAGDGANANQGAAYVFVRSGTNWLPQQKLTASDGAANDSFGASVALSGNTLLVGAEGDDNGTNTDQGSVYIFSRGGTAPSVWMQQQKLTASDGAAGDNFGGSLALSGDTVAIGAKMSDFGANNFDQGAVYIFVRTGAFWFPQQLIRAANGKAFDYFGQSIALSGDTLLVGAPGKEIGGSSDLGSAYVFARTESMWSQQRHLFADVDAANAQPSAPGGTVLGVEFGSAVAIGGDMLLVGAPNERGTFLGQGSTYAFAITANSHIQQQQLVANDGAANDGFGISVAIFGDTLAVGAYNDDIGVNANQGSVYIFTRSAAGWTQQQRLTANDGAADDNFGRSVVLNGETVLIGAPSDDIGTTTNQGSVYVFTRSGTVWTQQTKLINTSGAASDVFGFSLAVRGDLVVIGAPNDGNQGAAYVFAGSGASWVRQQRLIASDGAFQDLFGFSLAIHGDTLVIGANGDDFGTFSDQGSAYVFFRSGGIWTEQKKLFADDGRSRDNFGGSVAVHGDTVVAGAAGDQNGLTSTKGAVYVFTRNGTDWTKQQKLTANDGDVLDLLGFRVAISGDLIVATAPFCDIGGRMDQGAAYTFTRHGNVWTQRQKLTISDGASRDALGFSVFLSGNSVLIGSHSDDVGQNVNQGSAYTFACPACPTVTLTPDSLPDAQSGTPYSHTLTASAIGGGSEPYQFSFADGSLPPGVTLAQNGVLSGTPTVAGSYRFTVTATNLDSLCPGSRSYTVTVIPPCPTLTLDPPALPAAISGTAYSQQLSGGGTVLAGFTLTAGALPPGLSLSPTGLLSGTVTRPGIFNFTIGATALVSQCPASRSYSLTATCPSFSLTPPTLPAGQAGAAYSQQFGGNNAAPDSFAITEGELPPGLSLEQGGRLSGTPTMAGAFNFTVTGTIQSSTCSGSRNYALNIAPGCPALTVNPSSLPAAISGVEYNQQLSGSGGAAPYSFTLSAGALPTGLSLAANGALGGMPTVAGNFNFTVRATDANGCQGTRDYAVMISAPASNGLQFYPLAAPVRLLDTRPGQAGCFAPGAPIAGGTSHTQPVQGCDGLNIPASARAITGNITTVKSDGGYLTLYPSDAQQPLVANSNYAANEVINNVFTVGLGATGQDAGAFKIFASKVTDVVVDVTGYYAPPAATNIGGLYFHPLPKPIRLLETRSGLTGCTTPGAPLAGNTDTLQPARLTCDGVTIPAGAQAIVGNATTVSPAELGYLTLFPAGAARPLAASSNYTLNQVVNGPFTVGLSAAGEFNIFTAATTHLVVDVLGYYSAEGNDENGAGLLFNPLSKPVRLLETRAGLTGCSTPGAPLPADTELPQIAQGSCQSETIPATALAIVGNATVVNAQGGFLTFWPSNAAKPLVATSNFNAGQVFNRHFIVGLGPDGAFKMYAQLQTDLVVDVAGYFAP